ncbi:MAG: replicative DNA helicase [Verrucomicrobiota bacterium]
MPDKPSIFPSKEAAINQPISSQALANAGRSLPHSPDAEKGILGCCLIDPAEVISRCQASKLPAIAFYGVANQIIYETCIETFEKKGVLDVRVLAEELNSRGKLEECGGPMYVMDLAATIETTAHANYFLEVVREKYMLRRLIATATKTVTACFEPMVDGGMEKFVDDIEKEIFAISDDQVGDTSQPISNSVDSAVNLISKLLAGRGELVGTSSGFIDLDKMTYGLHGQEMVVLAARPSMGKTSLAMNIAEHVALPARDMKSGKGVLAFSLEMSAEQLTMRMLTCRAKVSSQRLREGFVNKEEQQRLAQAAKELKDYPRIWIDDSSQVTINQLRAKARRVFARSSDEMGLIIVDYLQLIAGTDPKMPREQQIAEISRGLKGLAKELNVPVIVLSQLNRDSEKEKRQPKLSDLRESGSIEQDADVVLLLARPKDAGDDFSVAADAADLIIAKHRNGPVGEIKLTFRRDYTRFENYTE